MTNSYDDDDEEYEELEEEEELQNTDEEASGSTNKQSGSNSEHANAKEQSRPGRKPTKVAPKSRSSNEKPAHARMSSNGQTSTKGRKKA